MLYQSRSSGSCLADHFVNTYIYLSKSIALASRAFGVSLTPFYKCILIVSFNNTIVYYNWLFIVRIESIRFSVSSLFALS